MKISPVGIGLIILGGAQMLLQQYQEEKMRSDLKSELKNEIIEEMNQEKESE